MHPVERYLTELRILQDAGTPETAGYPAFKALIDEIGKNLKPKVLCLIHPEDLGAGTPDAAFFTADQINSKTKALKPGQIPTGGVAEIKGPKDDLNKIVASKQVEKYLLRYGQVLVTNYREFRLVVRDRDNSYRVTDKLVLADSAPEFWKLAAHPQKTAEVWGARLTEFLTRALRNRAVLTEPKDVAWFLASYARDAMDQIAKQELPALQDVRTAFEQALGLTFTGEDGDHFFRSSLVQTLFYGVFSSWVLWSKEHPPTSKAVFNWRESIWTLRVPMIKALFEQVATPAQLGQLGLVGILENTGEVLDRVDRAAFFQKFQEAEAVQYFYEPFLEAFDPALRKELGVWYTPREVVQYQVARVDTVLREELGIKRGLADEQVVVLDPCCGTGAYLIEVLDRIGKTLKEEGGDALSANDLRKAVKERIFGFELLPAPFVVSHLQLGLLLQRLGAPLKGNDRAGVYLTNALTGWTNDDNRHLPFPELEQERELADEVKQQRKVLVILGNPPYNGYAGITESKEERELTQAYRTTKKAPKPQGQGLNDLYVRFFRMAERKIVEGTGRGVICFISNYSWLDGLSFTGMRERFLEQFDKIWIDNLNGDKYKTGKLTPEGESDPSIFSTAEDPVGIQVGTAIAMLVKKGAGQQGAEVRYRDIWGEGKLTALSVDAKAGMKQLGKLFAPLAPEPAVGIPFLPATVAVGYTTWPRLTDLMPAYFPGVQSKRDALVVDIDRAMLLARMEKYFDKSISHEAMAAICSEAIETANADFDLRATRELLLARGVRPEYFVPFVFRPLDLRWIYWEPEGDLLGRKSPDLFANVNPSNQFIVSQQRPRGSWDPPQVVTSLGCLDLMDRSASFFPLYLKEEAMAGSIFDGAPTGTKPNLSKEGVKYLSTMGAAREKPLFWHILAILHSPTYRAENAGALRQDWPRVPLPKDHALFDRSLQLGWELRLLLDPEVDRPFGPAAGYPHNQMKFGPLTTVGGGQLDPARGDLALEAGWGNPGKGGIVMPGKGRVTDHGDTLDIYLSDRAHWANVPKPVWEYTLGGYQVIKKWLSYREKKILGRDLTPEEARYVTEMVRRIAAIISMGPKLDANYEACKKDGYGWPGGV